MRCSPSSFLACFALLASAILLVIVSVTSPVVNKWALLTVDLPDSARGDRVTMGSFGYCVIDGASDGGDACSKRKVGYNPADVITNIERVDFSDYEVRTSKALTRVFVLHPVGAALSFLAFLVCLLNPCGPIFVSLVGSFLALLAFIVTLVALACDFVGLGLIRSNVNSFRGSGARASWSFGIWLVVTAFVLQFLGAIFAFFSCCHARRQKKHALRSDNGMSKVHGRRRWYGRHA